MSLPDCDRWISQICNEACNACFAQIIVPIILAVAVALTLAAVCIVVLGGLFSALIRDYGAGWLVLAYFGILGIGLMLPFVMNSRQSQRNASMGSMIAALIGLSLCIGDLSALLGKGGMLIPVLAGLLLCYPVCMCWSFTWAFVYSTTWTGPTCWLLDGDACTWPTWLSWPSFTRRPEGDGSRPLLSSSNAQANTAMPMDQLLDCFLRECRVSGEELLARKEGKWLTRQDLEELMPGVVVGLPAFTLLRAVQRTLDAKEGEGLLITNGQLLTEQNRPAALGAQRAYKWMIEAKNAFARLRPEDAELSYIEACALWEGVEAPAGEDFCQGEKVSARQALRRQAGGVAGLFGRQVPVPAGRQGYVRDTKGEMLKVCWDGTDDCEGWYAKHDLAPVGDAGRRLLPAAARGEPAEDERRQLVATASGRLRSAAIFLTRLPFFQRNFHSKVIKPLLQNPQGLLGEAKSAEKMPPAQPALKRAVSDLIAATACEIARLRSEDNLPG